MDAVTKVVTDSFIKQLQSTEKLPWEVPYLYHNAFGYMSKHTYTGINRWLVPFGEYFTRKGITDYNEENGTNYKFAKGIKWYPILYYGDSIKEISVDSLPDEVKASYNRTLNTPQKVQIASTYGGKIRYYEENGKIFKHSPVRRYYRVADRTHFVDDNGNCPPSRLGNGLHIEYARPDSLADMAIRRLALNKVLGTRFHFDAQSRTITVADSKYCPSEWFYYFHLFRVIAQATKLVFRQNSNLDARQEECICLVTAGLLCAESNVCDKHGTILDPDKKNYSFQGWVDYFDNNKDKIIGIMHEADKAYNYILG